MTKSTLTSPLTEGLLIVYADPELNKYSMDVLECKVCFEQYNSDSRKPRSFGCGHSYCSVCVEDILKRGKALCPGCRQEHSASSINSFPINYSIMSLIEAVECNSLDLASLRVADTPIKPPQMSAGLCDEHGNHLVFFCMTCDAWICRDCTVCEHQSKAHDVITIKAVFSRKKGEGQTTLDLLEKKSKQQVDHLTQYLNELQIETVMLENLSEQIKKAMSLNLKEQDRLKQTLVEGEQYQVQLAVNKTNIHDATTLDDVSNACAHIGSSLEGLEQWSIECTKRLMSTDDRNNFLKVRCIMSAAICIENLY